MNFNHESIGVLKFHYITKHFNIADWEIYYDNTEYKGSGFGSLKQFCETLPQNKTTVIYCRDVKLLYVLNKNGKFFEFGEGRLSSNGPGNFDFFTLKTKDETIEFREWNNWFDKIDDCKQFYINFYCTMNYFKTYDIEKFGLYTLSNDCFRRGIKYRKDDYINLKLLTMREYVKRCVPQDEFTLEFYENYWRGGMAFYNPFFKDKVHNNITSFDKKSCHLATMIFEKFPLTDFVDVDLTYWKEVEANFDITAFIAEMKFEGLKQKSSSILGADVIWRFGGADKNGDWWIRINDIDWQWFREEFEWKKAYICNLKVAQKSYLPKDMVSFLLKLYEEKEAAEKGTVERIIAKQCTELCYGQSIKRLYYEYDAELDEEGEVKITQNPEPSFKEKQDILAQRNLPLQLGIWTVSYSRLDIWKAANLVGACATVYCDTDCIKTTKGSELQSFLNKEIEQKAAMAQKRFSKLSIPKNLGRWDYEYTADEFIVAGLKWYAYKIDSTIKFKAAGAQLDTLEKWFKTHEIEEFNTKMEIDGLFKLVKYDLDKNYAKITYNNYFNDYMMSEQMLYESEIKL